ncbi:MAG: hypothetical protein R3288_09440 [Woeseiaceae bacterium]|nr:hypothetical protein [Woeseiaceae bacterium]
MDKNKLKELFYEQAKMFADLHGVSLDDIADAQFHASLRMIFEKAGIENMTVWVDNQAREFRRGLSASKSWAKRRAAAD